MLFVNYWFNGLSRKLLDIIDIKIYKNINNLLKLIYFYYKNILTTT